MEDSDQCGQGRRPQRGSRACFLEGHASRRWELLPDYKEMLARREQYRDLLLEAEIERLIGRMGTRPRRWLCLVGRSMAWVGERLQSAGRHLQGTPQSEKQTPQAIRGWPG